MVLLIERLLVIRSTAWTVWVTTGAMDEISCSISRRRLAPSLICGVTLRVTPMSWRSMVVKGLSAPEALVVKEPVWKGTFWPTRISAFW
ncbi:hypothetical protein D3C86_1707490 [compost metagenome]